MPRSLCILHANCQGEALRPLLEHSPQFSKYFILRHYTNYIREPIPQTDLEHCGLFLYQFLGSEWHELASDYLLQQLPAHCLSLRIPNLFFKGYWPFWTKLNQGIDFADSFVEELLTRGLNAVQIIHLYLQGKMSTFQNIPATAEHSLAREEAKEKGSPIRCAHLLRTYWQEEQLFLTVNHPGTRLIFSIATQLLELLNLGKVPENVLKNYRHPQDDFWLPLHPLLGSILHLPFAFPERRYKVYGVQMTFQEYLTCYLACRETGINNLPAALHTLAQAHFQLWR